MLVTPLLLGLAMASAQAATVQFSVTGLVQARSAIVLADAGSGVQEIGCQDNGEAPDIAVDGSWTCHELTTKGSELWVVLATDSGVVRVGSIPINAPKLNIGLEKTGSGVRVQVDPPTPDPDPSMAAQGPGMMLITRLHSAASQGAPMLLVTASDQSVEHPCRDDGTLFDAKLNDGHFICTGYLPGPRAQGAFNVTVSLRQADGESRDIATLKMQGGAGMRFASIDVSAVEPPSALAFDLQVLPGASGSKGIGTPPAAPQTQVVTGGQAVVGPPASSPMVRPGPGPAPGSGSGPWKLLSLALVASLGLVVYARRVVVKVPAALEPVGTRRLGRVGPRPGGTPVTLQVQDPLSALPQLVAQLSGQRRIVLLGEVEPLPALDVAHAVYTVRSNAMADAIAAVKGLVKSPGPPVAVVVINPQVLHPDASMSPTPLAEFYEALDAVAWCIDVVPLGASGRQGLDRWAMNADGSWSRPD